MKLFGSNIKKNSYIFKKGSFSYISRNKKFLIFPEIELSSSNIKKNLIFSKRKVFVILSQKKFFVTFPEMEPNTF